MRLNAHGGVLNEGPPISLDDQKVLRQNNGLAMLTLAAERGWTDEQLAGYFNDQHGTGGTWTAANVADQRTFLENTGQLAATPGRPAPDGAPFTTEVTLGGRRYQVVYTLLN